MTFEEQDEISGAMEEGRKLVEDMGRKIWNVAVLACEDEAYRRYDEAEEDEFAPGDAFDEAMEAVRGLARGVRSGVGGGEER